LPLAGKAVPRFHVAGMDVVMLAAVVTDRIYLETDVVIGFEKQGVSESSIVVIICFEILHKKQIQNLVLAFGLRFQPAKAGLEV
jgi:hypothetical protein